MGGFRTGSFDKNKYELLEFHIKQLFIGYCIKGFLTCCIGLVIICAMLKIGFVKKYTYEGFFCKPTNNMLKHMLWVLKRTVSMRRFF